jgi:hypothetical protein
VRWPISSRYRRYPGGFVTKITLQNEAYGVLSVLRKSKQKTPQHVRGVFCLGPSAEEAGAGRKLSAYMSVPDLCIWPR